jgi:hypothetical protein
LTADEIKRIYANTTSLIEEVHTAGSHHPIVIMDENGNPAEALPIVTETSTNAPTRKVSEYMEGVDQVLSYQIINLGQKLKTTHIENKVAGILHDIAEQDKAKEEVVSKAYAIRKVAKELMSMPYESPDILAPSALNKLIEEKSVNIFSEKGIKYLEVAGENVELQQNPARMSSRLFERAKDMERGLLSIEQSKARLEDQINKLKKKAISIEAKSDAIQHI